MRTRGLTKFYGSNRGIEGLDLEVRRGEVFGFLGPNGAGKTTTIRLLLDLIHPTRGAAEVLSLDPRRDGAEMRARVGYLPGDLGLYERLTGEELVAFLDRLRGGGNLHLARELAERLDLELGRRISQLSRGNRQKVGIVQAFMHQPELLILDEPSNAIDPLVQQEVRALMAEAAGAGATVFLSSHVLHEVQHVAGRVGIVRRGALVAVEAVDDITAMGLRQVAVHFARAVPDGAFDRIPGCSEVTVTGAELRCRVTGSFDPLLHALAQYEVLSLTSEEADLEDVFLEYYRGDG